MDHGIPLCDPRFLSNISLPLCFVGNTPCGIACCSQTKAFCADASKSLCCLIGQHNQNGICCPVGETNIGGICCPPGTHNANGICCGAGMNNADGICCPGKQTRCGNICCAGTCKLIGLKERDEKAERKRALCKSPLGCLPPIFPPLPPIRLVCET